MRRARATGETAAGDSRDRRAARVAPFGETVFATYSALARSTGAVNLGQGFPDDPPAPEVTAALKRAADGPQQYAPLAGDRRLLEALAASLGPRLGRDLDPTSEVLVTVGATEGLFATLQALVDPGDEVVLVEPWYDAYPAMVHMAGGRVRSATMRRDGERWRLDHDSLAAAVSDRTRVILVNTPHNPTGAVYDGSDLDAILAAAERVAAVVVSDEVYEHLAFVPFERLAARPEAFGRTLTVSSVGKSFGVTGWKVGWVHGPDDLVAAVRAAHQWIPFAVATPLQRAAAELVADADARDGAPYRTLRDRLQARRDVLRQLLQTAGFEVNLPDAGYFVVADARPLGVSDEASFARALPHEAGVIAIPMGAFVSETNHHLVAGHLRFAFCKGDDALEEAGRRLRAWTETRPAR